MNQRGFTILELMMVVTIIGVLSMIAITEMSKATNQAYVGAAMNDVQLLRQAIAMYDAEWGVYPQADANNLVSLVAQLVDPNGALYIDPPSGNNFTTFAYSAPAGGDLYGDYQLEVICLDPHATLITVTPEDVSTFRTN
jgi:general secretion pathway protein G